MNIAQEMWSFWSSAREEMVLGTVVDVRGSAYRRPGASVLISRSGERVGMISGGCLDKDLVRKAWAWTENGPSCVLYDTRGDELHPEGRYGSGCDGLVRLFLERVRPGECARVPLMLRNQAREDLNTRVVATVYEASGAFGDLLGAREVLEEGKESSQGLFRDSGDLQELLWQQMREHPAGSRPVSVTLRNERGSVTALVEHIEPPLDLLVLGAGDDVRPLVAQAALMGWSTRVADKWPLLATPQRFPGARNVLCGSLNSLRKELRVRASTFVVVMTHNFEDDLTWIPWILERSPAYLGLMGPRRRTAQLFRRLFDRGMAFSSEQLDCVQTPVGLDLGGDLPEEVAMSIIAGVVAYKNGRSGSFLSLIEGKIHDEHVRKEVSA